MARLGKPASPAPRSSVLSPDLCTIVFKREVTAVDQVNLGGLDPVEAYIARCTPETARWMRAHPDDAHVIATNSDPQPAAKLTASHNDALAEGFKPDTPNYFNHVERFLGQHGGDGDGPRRRRGDDGGGDGGEPAVKVLKRGEKPEPGTCHVKMTKREYELATDGSLTWETGPKRGQPLGVAEYLRRKGITDTAPEWKRLD